MSVDDDEEAATLWHAHRNPSFLFIAMVFVENRHGERIDEDSHRFVETDAVLCDIASGLLGIPVEFVFGRSQGASTFSMLGWHTLD